MRAGTEVTAAVLSLVTVQITTSFGAIALLGRMAPAIERILEENVVSLAAVEDMLVALATAKDSRGGSDGAPARFEAALARAAANITEAEEEPLLARLRQLGPAALAGDAEAAEATVTALAQLATINHQSMRVADDKAKNLGAAGAWAVVFLAAVALLASTLIIGRLRRRLVVPLAELDEVLAAVARGDGFRRCQPLPAALELARVSTGVNILIDASRAERAEQVQSDKLLERGALLHLLDERAEPVALVDSSGGVVAVNEAALGVLTAEHGDEVRAALADAAAGGDGGAQVVSSTPLGSGAGSICVLRAP